MRFKSSTAALWLLILVPLGTAVVSARALIEDFFPEVTYLDLGVFFILGLISGIGLGMVLTSRRKAASPGSQKPVD